MMRGLLILLMLLPTAASANSRYAVRWESKQDATFVKKDCKGLSSGQIAERNKASQVFDACACTGQILYPQMDGLPDDIRQAVNSSLRARVDADGCDDETAYALPKGKEGDRRLSRFDVSYAGRDFISFLLWHDSYNAGAPHNMWTAEGASFDLKNGKALSLADLLLPEKLPEINAKIADMLDDAYASADRDAPSAIALKKPETPKIEDKKPDAAKADAPKSEGEVAAAKDAAAKPVGETKMLDDKPGDKPADAKPSTPDYVSLEGCKGCTYHLTPEGLELVFQLYEVASFADGNPKITIGREYLNPTIRERL